MTFEHAMGPARGIPMERGLRVAKPRRSVKAAERVAYDLCHAAMLAGGLYQWAIDDEAGCWQVQELEGGEWASLTMGEVVELVSRKGFSPAVRVATVRKVAPKVKAVATMAHATGPERKVTKMKKSNGAKGSDTVEAYLARLVHAPKRAYAEAYAAHLAGDGSMPVDPGAEWAGKVRVKLDRLVVASSARRAA